MEAINTNQASIILNEEKVIINQELVSLLDLNGSSFIELYPIEENLYIAVSEGIYSIQLKPLNESELYFESVGLYKLLSGDNTVDNLIVNQTHAFKSKLRYKAYKIEGYEFNNTY